MPSQLLTSAIDDVWRSTTLTTSTTFVERTPKAFEHVPKKCFLSQEKYTTIEFHCDSISSLLFSFWLECCSKISPRCASNYMTWLFVETNLLINEEYTNSNFDLHTFDNLKQLEWKFNHYLKIAEWILKDTYIN